MIRSGAVGVCAAALVTAANASEGGYFSQSWGWIALAFIAPVSLALIVGVATSPGAFRFAFAALMTLLGVWVAVSAAWSLTPAGSLREAERMLVYVGLAGALALVLRRSDAVALAAGALAGTVAVAAYALATRLFPDRIETYDSPFLPDRLSEPIGYWNSLGLLAAMGILLAFGFVAHERRRAAAAVAAASLPILFGTLYFTFSRGAWAALVLGGAAFVALDPNRLRALCTVVAVVPASLATVAVAARQDALTTADAPRADAVAQGQRLALVVVGLALASALVAFAARWIGGRLPAPRWSARALDAALVALVVAAVAAGFVLVGGPREALAEIERRFEAPPPVEGGNLNERLFSTSANGRSESIGVAWDAGRERPLVGHGAGSYEYLWYENRPSSLIIRDAHSLYAEVFAELGVVGVVLLGLALIVPLAAAVRTRRTWIIPAAAAAYTAWAAHAAIDWHWEVVGVTVVALLAGGVGLLAAEDRMRPLAEAERWSLLAASTVFTVVALVSLVGNQALFGGREALAREEWAEARKHARLAEKLLPWSYEPHVVLGDAAARSGNSRVALESYRRAVRDDPRSWAVWLRLGQVARGAERRRAYELVRELNPLEPGPLPGEAQRPAP